MSKDIIDLYIVYETVDEYGRHGSTVAYAKDEYSAEQAAKNRGWWGGSGAIVKKKALVVDGEVYPLLTSGPVTLYGEEPKKDWKAIRRAALAKLTEEERAALEVKEQQ